MIELPPPLALARPVESLSAAGAREPVFEAKYDGYRAAAASGRIFSRQGRDLGRYFPDLVPVLRSRLPAGAVVDGELVAWDPAAGRLDFASLQSRLTAGRRIGAVAARRPAQLVCFDLLADAAGRDLRGLPLRERRSQLEQLLLGQTSPLVLCQQTSDVEVAAEWLTTLVAGGVEGIVIKDAASPYPTQPNQRVWWKVKARQTLDLLAVGVTGEPTQPRSLVLADPADPEVTVGVTTVLPRALARTLAPLLVTTGSRWERHSSWGSPDRAEVHGIDPIVVEVSADVAVDHGVLRHAARLVRVRPDLTPSDLE